MISTHIPQKESPARGATGNAPATEGSLRAAPSATPVGHGGAALPTGRHEGTLALSDLPDPVETVDATGDLSEDEERILALCMRGIRQFEDAWWVMGKAMANINNRRLYRATHATFADFVQDVFHKSRPTAYEEMTSYAIGELLSARADTAHVDHADTAPAHQRVPAIGKKAAGALNPITKDYGAETSIAVHETIKEATRTSVTVKAINGIVQRLPRRDEKELSQEELIVLVRQLASDAPQPRQPVHAVQPSALDALRHALTQLQAALRWLSQADITKALEENADETARTLACAREAAGEAAVRATAMLHRPMG
ncbi:hypothetical protein [Streptomyces sp. NBC_01190]|uniref:hypothetical protein n=1 Tax=Streptomyces sp. NBC_01190 TaxID=2903767 RepID=UPI003865FE4B|nr:hypothetical protein OG519_30190 [Streptomyces sp. NBC_01190]